MTHGALKSTKTERKCDDMKLWKVTFSGAECREDFSRMYAPGLTPVEAVKNALHLYKINKYTWSFDGISIEYVREVAE